MNQMSLKQLTESIQKLPNNPGVYLFKDKAGRILYVGKAINLKNRVKSYFNKDLAASRGQMLVEMVNQAARVDFEATDSEIEALILEANLIRRLKPKYNSAGKDDKSASFIKIDWSDRYPRIYLVRGKEVDTGSAKSDPKSKRQDKLFGPYMAAGSMKAALKTIRRIFPYRDCTAAKFQSYSNLGRGCLFHQLGRCPAPCIKAVSEKEYRQRVKDVVDFLEGKKVRLIKDIERDMRQASKLESYELAAELRDRLFALNHLHQLAHRGILQGFEDKHKEWQEGYIVEAYDISNIQGEMAVGSQVRARVPKVEGDYDIQNILFEKERYRSFRIRSVKTANDTAMLAEVLLRRLKRAKKEPIAWSLPDLIIVDGGKGQLSATRQVAKGLGIKTPIIAVAKGPTRKKTDLYINPNDRLKIILTTEELKKVALVLREEAHRFAISYYRNLHRKRLLTTGKRK